ncbi:hypothetical protein AMECASPLE_015892 [Ameca splendens]|uniref:Uncharacterized protein n=1 Tax=Ameca splendens TaxID=208324 RepID=A0ABV0Z0M0_9TELE
MHLEYLLDQIPGVCCQVHAWQRMKTSLVLLPAEGKKDHLCFIILSVTARGLATKSTSILFSRLCFHILATTVQFFIKSNNCVFIFLVVMFVFDYKMKYCRW